MRLTRKKRLLAAAVICALAVPAAGCGSDTGNANSIHSYEVEKYVTLGDYDGMEVEVAGNFDVNDEDVVDYINNMLSNYPSYEDTDKEIVENGDFADIDYVGKKDGVAFDGGTAQGYVLEIGSGSFIEGFEDGLVGVKVGDTVDLNLTFPENYQSAELAGADVVFTVTVNKIVKKVDISYDALTDEYVTSNMGSDSVEDLYNDTKSYLETTNEQKRTVAEREAVLNKLIENSKVAIPDGLLDMKVDQYTQQFIRQNCTDDTTLSDYLSANYNMSEDDFKSTITAELENNLDDELVLEALVKAEGEALDEEGFQEYISNMMNNGGYKTEDELYAAYDSDYEEGKAYLQNRYLLTDALTNLLDKCKITYTGADAEGEAE